MLLCIQMKSAMPPGPRWAFDSRRAADRRTIARAGSPFIFPSPPAFATYNSTILSCQGPVCLRTILCGPDSAACHQNGCGRAALFLFIGQTVWKSSPVQPEISRISGLSPGDFETMARHVLAGIGCRPSALPRETWENCCGLGSACVELGCE